MAQKQLVKKACTTSVAAKKTVKKAAETTVTAKKTMRKTADKTVAKKTAVKKTAAQKPAGKNGNGKTSADQKQKTVTFSCYSPDSGIVEVAGNFNNWNPAQTPMKKGKDGNWSAKLKLPAGCYQYKFVFDGNSWENDPNAPIVASEIAFNNLLEVQ